MRRVMCPESQRSAFALLIAAPHIMAALAGCSGKAARPTAPLQDPPACLVAPATLDFGSVGVGQSVDLAFSITNSGGGSLSGTVSVPCAEFAVIGNGTYVLGAGQQATFTIRFSPANAGAETCAIGSGAAGCATITCTGTGVDTAPACSVTPTELDFGAVRVGEHADRTFTITNSGEGTLSGTVSAACAEFAVIGSGTYVLGVGQQATITIRFSPADAGAEVCAIGAGNVCANVHCTGTGFDGDGAWSQVLAAGDLPGKREQHCMVLDPVRDRLIVFGGSSFTANWNDVWSLDLSGQPRWTQLQPQGAGPEAGTGATGVYDSARQRMVVFGGIAGGIARNDVRVLSLDGAPAWTEIAPAGTLPAPRTGHSAIYDPVRDRMLIFGGWSGAHPFYDDVWELSLGTTPTWTRLTPSGSAPDPRIGHDAIFDPIRDRMILFGGNVGGSPMNDTWALSLGAGPAWTPLAPAGSAPARRIGHSAIYDAARDRMVVFGGAFPNDTWALPLAPGAAWTLLQPAGAPSPERNWQGAVYDGMRDRLLMFGGRDVFAFPNDGLNDTWVLTW